MHVRSKQERPPWALFVRIPAPRRNRTLRHREKEPTFKSEVRHLREIDREFENFDNYLESNWNSSAR